MVDFILFCISSSVVVALGFFWIIHAISEKSYKACAKCIKTMKVERLQDIKVGDYIKILRKKRFWENERHGLVSEVAAQKDGCRILEVKLICAQFPFESDPNFMTIKENWEKYNLDSTDLYVLKYPKTTLSQEKIETESVSNYRFRSYAMEAMAKIQIKEGFLDRNFIPQIKGCGHFISHCHDCEAGHNLKFRMKKWIYSLVRGELPVDQNTLFCMICKRHKVRKRVIRDESECKVGDIITRAYMYRTNSLDLYYCYGVIIQVNLTKPFICHVVYYNMRRQKVMQEICELLPNRTEVITYDKSKITVNSIDVVCRRAQSRVGETFQGFADGSNEFARWCKLADFQPNIELNFISFYIYMFFMKVVAPCHRFLRDLFSKPNISAVRIVRFIQGENNYKVGDVILFAQNQATALGIVVEIMDGGHPCHVVYLNSRDRILVRQDVNVRFGCTEIMEFDESVFFLNPPEEVRKRACQRLGEKYTEGNSYDFIEHCKLCKHQPRSILVFFVIILHSIWNIIYFIAETKFFLLNPIFLYFKLGRIAAIIALVSFLLEKQDNKKSFKWSKLISYVILVWIAMNINQWLKLN